MKKSSKISLLLVLSLLMSGCAFGEEGNTDSTGGDSTADTVNNDSLSETRKSIDDGLSEYEGLYSGYTFRLTASDGNEAYLVVEEDELGDVVNKAVHDRNIAVEDRFGCTIEVVHTAKESEAANYIRKCVMTMEDAFDLTCHHVVSQGGLALSDYYINWYDIPAVDFSKPWWSDSTVEDLSFNDNCYIAIGDVALTARSNAYCVYFNKTDAEKYNLPNLYEVVYDGEWTIDYILELTKDVYDDLNRNNQIDDGDYFGYVTDPNSNITAYQWAFENPVFKTTGDSIEIVYKTEKIVDIVEKLVEAVNLGQIRTNKNYVNSIGKTAHWYGIEMFAKGQALFSNGYIAQSLSHLRDMDDDYGILPYPKWNEEQEDYHTMADGNHTSLAVPKTVGDDRIEFVGVITEAMCAESYKILLPAYYDEALKLKGTRDDESIQMIEYVVDSCVYDMGYVYDNWKGLSFLLQQLVANGDTNFESFYASKSSSALAHYDKVINYFETGSID